MVNQQTRLSDLFYYDPAEKKCADLQKGLKEYQFLLKASALAIAHLKQGNLEKFDSLVGENACQIRAIKIALIAAKEMDGYDLLNEKISAALDVIEALLVPATINSLMLEGRSLCDILDLYQIHVQLSSEEIFVITAFMLSEMKEKKTPEETLPALTQSLKFVPNNLQIQDTQVSSSFKNFLSNRLRKILSEASVNFVKKAADSIQDQQLLKIVTDYTTEHKTWSCAPMFWACKALFGYAEEMRVPLVLHAKFLDKVEHGFHVVNEEFLYFKPCEIKKCYVEFTPDKEIGQMSACVIEGAVCPSEDQPLLSSREWKERLLQHSVVDIVLAGAADHRQYPNPDLIVDVLDEDYEHYKKLAKQNGFSLCNPSTFFIQHVYSSQILGSETSS